MSSKEFHKEFHIVSTGVSLITNAQRVGIINKEIKISDEDYWNNFYKTPEYSRLEEFIRSQPKNSCAELSTILDVSEGKNKSDIQIYLFGTKTSSNELCRKLISDYLNDLGFSLLTSTEVSGYFREAYYNDITKAENDFVKDTSILLDKLVRIANRKKEDGYEVYFNPTGGLKAHVIVCAVAGFLTGGKVYYKNEEFKDIVFLPPLIYVPTKRELELLKEISNKNRLISGKEEVKKLRENYSDELERMRNYRIIDIEEENNTEYRIKMNSIANLILKNYLNYE
ncbi:MAG: putative CRISPR-associated protein [Candidatus Aenigmatarchaeota archaeon]